MKKIRIDRDALKFLWLLACLPNFGCLRLIEHCTETAIDLEPDVITIDLPEPEAAAFEVTSEGATYREWCIPAAIASAHLAR